MKINDIIETEILDYGINGEGVAKQNGIVIFVPFAMVGEVVQLKIKKIKNEVAFGEVIKIVKPSPNRQIPKCEYFGKCGGCILMHLPYQTQLEVKKNNVQKTLAKNFKNIKINNVIGCENQFFYRNKIEFVVKNNCVGFYEKNSHNILKINNCLLLNNCENIIKILNNYLQKINNKLIYQIIIRNINNSLTIIFLGNLSKLNNVDFLVNLLLKYYEKISIFIGKNNNKYNENINSLKLIYGENTIINNDDLICEYSPNSFLQINSQIEQKLYNDIINLIDENSNIINAFSGAGFLSAKLAKKAKIVYGVEIVENANLDAIDLMKKNNIKNVVNICGDCTIEIPKLAKKLCNENLNIILDPARAGATEQVMTAINSSNAKKVIYVSCAPSTLARDLKFLSNYEIASVQPYDMFPQTSHVETLVVLNRK